ncbi:hypothetical protein [Arthrobacter sp. B1805]|uniref:hypothetical protein n=1 Tax=Arthrobacter sp. B1805 TaxID=2058892 RepID=UPI0011B0CDE6|nr:hypothetical protein [Arthrobacter sp. B1805]
MTQPRKKMRENRKGFSAHHRIDALTTVLGGYPSTGVVMAVLATISVVTTTRTRAKAEPQN